MWVKFREKQKNNYIIKSSISLIKWSIFFYFFSTAIVFVVVIVITIKLYDQKNEIYWQNVFSLNHSPIAINSLITQPVCLYFDLLPYLTSVSLPPSKENHTVSYVKHVLGGGALYSAVRVKIPSPPYPWIKCMYTKNQAYSHGI